MRGSDRIGGETDMAALMAACWQPWEALNGWNAYWGTQWREWFESFVSAPNPWVPALADERSDRSAAIDFFLPWLPRIEAVAAPLETEQGRDVVRVMMRAALPFSGARAAAEWLNVDAIVTRGSAASLPEPLAPPVLLDEEAAPAPTPAEAKPARRTRKPRAGRTSETGEIQ